MSTNDEETRAEIENEETAAAETAVAEPDDFKMSMDVQIEESGPCKKHVRIKIPRDDIEHYYDEALGELCSTATVPGFRVGHVPRKLVERRFRKELNDQVKQKLLIESLDHVAEQNKLDPINEPNIDFENIEIPEEGDLEFEFDVEVRPDFDLPDYEGLKIKRPVRQIGETDIEISLERFLSQYGQLVPYDGAAEQGDYVCLAVDFQHNGRSLHKLSELNARLKPVLRFQDAELEGFDELMAGVKAGETRDAELTISRETESLEMRGETVQARFTVLDVKRLRLPELTKDFLQRIGVESEEELREEVRQMIERQVTFQQRQTVRAQVLEKITESADWELPEELVLRQVDNALRREVLEMQQAGFTNQEIQTRENEIRQRAVSTTRQALKEHFVLDKIAGKEKIEVEPADIEGEIQLMAMQQRESPRRVRARLTKSGMIENLKAQIRERKACDFILARAEYEEVEVEPPAENRVEAIAHSVCGLAVDASATQADENQESVESDSEE